MKSTLPASLIGQWASYDFDTQLHLFPDASVLLDIGALGEVGVQAALTQDEDGTLRFTSAFLSGELRPVNDTLEGTCLYEEEKSHAVFKKIGEQPLPHAYHHAPFGEPIQVPDDFPLSAEQLAGSYRTQVPNLLYMSLAAVDGGARLALSIDDSTAFQHRAAWCEDGALVWQVNDAFHRITCTLRPGENRSLCGSYSLPGQAIGEEICFEKTSDAPRTWIIPEEKPDSVVLPENVSRLELLQRYAAYGSGEARPDARRATRLPLPAWISWGRIFIITEAVEPAEDRWSKFCTGARSGNTRPAAADCPSCWPRCCAITASAPRTSPACHTKIPAPTAMS